MSKICKSEFSRFDRKIREAEAEELRRMNATESTLEMYFENKRRTELSRKPLKDMNWAEIHELDELRKSMVEDRYTDQTVSNPSPEELQSEIYKVLQQCEVAASQNRPDLVEDFRKLGKLLRQSQLGKVTEPHNTEEESDEDITNDAPVSISQGLSIQKSNGVTLVSGFSSIQEIDSAGDVFPVSEILKDLPRFYKEDGKICLQHNTQNIIGKLRSYELKKDKNKIPGIYVTVELTDSTIEKKIESGDLKGFSWSFSAKREKTCEKDKCYQNLKLIPKSITELSLVSFPCNQNALIDRVSHSSS